jgi:hypothetical protein
MGNMSTTHHNLRDLAGTAAADTTAAPPEYPMPWRGYTPPLEHTASAVAAMDAGDPRPGPVQTYGPAPVGGDWVPFVVGVLVGAVACYAVLVMAP